MKRVMKALCCLILFCVAMLAMLAISGCGIKKPVAPGAPAATTLDKLSASAFEIANALDSGEKEYEALYLSNLPGVSDDGYAKTITQMFLGAQNCTSSYIGQLKSLVTVDDSNRAQVVGWSKAVISCVDELINSGVVGIKNPAARQKIQALLAPIPAAIKLIADAMGVPVATSIRPCDGACAALNFTEVNFDTRTRSRTHSPGNSVGGEPARISFTPQASKRSYRSAAPGRCRQAQRRCRDQDTGIPFASQRRLIANPVREAWLYA
ncbi:MAG TPA: hypothetical protein VGP89_09395 [Candidatus Angelobacter sp.]|nr:hypothetical protein [Candidatus Angelobacter sp.]